MMTTVPHTLLRNGIYWLNLRWNKAHLRFTLRTREPTKAFALVAMILERLDDIKGKQVDVTKIKQLVRQWLHTQTNQLEHAAANAGYYKHPLTIGNPVYSALMKGIQKDFDQSGRDLEHGNFSLMKDEAERFANEYMGRPPESSEIAFLCRELTLAKRELARRILEHDYPDRFALDTSAHGESTTSTDKLNDTWEKYLSESIARGNLKERSEVTYRQYFERFLDIVGDMPFTSFTKDIARTYKEELLDYPAYRSSNEKRKAMSYQEVKLEVTKRLSTSTINSDMVAINGFLSWAVDHGYLSSNPLEGMIVTRDKEEEERESFTQEDLTLIFSQPRFQGEKAKGQRRPVSDDDYWLPLLALFTGARIEELSRLRKKDIQSEGAVHYMEVMPPDLAPEMSERKKKSAGKSKAAHRKIPIHPTLMDELNFREFVESKDEGYLFTLKEQKKRRSFYPSKDFGLFKTKLGLDEDKVFHSFRHTLRDSLTAAGISGEFIKGIMGHSMKGDVTFGTYGSGMHLQPTVLAPHLNTIDYSQALSNVLSWEDVKDKLIEREIT
jgi:integrase